MKFFFALFLVLLFHPLSAQSAGPPEGIYFSADLRAGLTGGARDDSQGGLFLVGKTSSGLRKDVGIVGSVFGLYRRFIGDNLPVTIDPGDLDFHVGFKKIFSSPAAKQRVGMRFEGGLKWMRTELGTPVPFLSREELSSTSFSEFLQQFEINIEGEAHIFGPRGGMFLDLRLYETDHFVYVGTSFGLVNLGLEYDVHSDRLPLTASTDDSAWISMFQYDAGLGIQLRERLGLKLGYQFATFQDALMATPFAGTIEASPNNRHTLRISFVHWFRRK